MLIPRDLAYRLTHDKGYLIQILIGPRQCGKSTLYAATAGKNLTEINLDDLQLRQLANRDPALLLMQYPPPLLIDEIQYAPNLFPELKRIIDNIKKDARLSDKPINPAILFRLTGSNQILLDKNVKETLVGRASYYYLNTLSVHEIKNAFPHLNLTEILFKGGWPELYINEQLSSIQYLNEYIRNYIEKDIILSAGITKQNEFNTVLGMLAARTGNFINYSSIAQDSGVKSVTVQEWVSVLERTGLIYLLPPAASNINKRLTKAHKFYFLDTGLAARLQGWMEVEPMLKSPHVGSLFETLVLAEIVKCKNNFGKEWKISVWHTKDEQEIDFLIETARGDVIALDAKLGVHGAQPITLPKAIKAYFPNIKEIGVVTLGGEAVLLNQHCRQIPLQDLTQFLLSFD